MGWDLSPVHPKPFHDFGIVSAFTWTMLSSGFCEQEQIAPRAEIPGSAVPSPAQLSVKEESLTADGVTTFHGRH